MNTTTETWQRSFPTATSGAHLFPEFEERAKAVSAEVFRVATPAEAREALLKLVEAAGVKKAVVVESPLQIAAGVTEALRSRGNRSLHRAYRDRRARPHRRHRDLRRRVRGRRDGERLPRGLRDRDPAGHDPPAAPRRLPPQREHRPRHPGSLRDCRQELRARLRRVHHGTEPDRRHRTGAHHWCSWAEPVRDHRR